MGTDFREAKRCPFSACWTADASAGVLLDRHPVVHLVYAKDLHFAAVATKFVILAHDERLDWLGRANFRAQAAKAAARQVEVEVVEDLDLLSGLSMSAERDEIVGAGLRALVADDAGLSAGGRLDLKPQHAPESRRRGPALGRVLERERRLRGVFERDPQPFQQVHEKNGLQE